MIETILKHTAVFGLAFLIGWFLAAVDHQDAYTEGRHSVLNDTVRIGGDDSPCSASIPLSVLAEMVNAGVIDWHAACKEQIAD